jgi:hypothetical protein
MTDSDRVRFAKIMAYLSLNFPHRRVERHLIESYFHDLAGYDVVAIEAAARKHVRAAKSFPFVADLVASIEA